MQKEIIHLINLKIYLNMQKKKVLILQFMLEKMAIDYIKQALKFCNRIEHRFDCHNDINVLKELSNKKIPLTLCPVSNLKLNVINDLKIYPIRDF